MANFPVLCEDYIMLRTLFRSDLSQIVAIEQSVHVSPWTEETFAVCFQSGYIGWAIEFENKVIGFVIVSMAREECHVLNLCVAHAFQRQGWGRKLLEKVMEQAKRYGISTVYLEVRRSNTRAIALYEAMRFQQIGERKGYYPTVAGNEDALIFAVSLLN